MFALILLFFLHFLSRLLVEQKIDKRYINRFDIYLHSLLCCRHILSQIQLVEAVPPIAVRVERSPHGGIHDILPEYSNKWTSENIARIIEEKADMKLLFITVHITMFITKHIEKIS